MAGDAVQVAPNFYKVLLENDRVRVLESRTKLGDKADMHSHPAIVAYALSDEKFIFTMPDGQTMDVELEQGQSMYLDEVTHGVENVGTGEAHILLVELK